MTQTVTRGESLGAQVARVLRQRIVRGELAPGARITEEALAEEFSVSRGPVRDALTQLSFEKLVEVQRRLIALIAPGIGQQANQARCNDR